MAKPVLNLIPKTKLGQWSLGLIIAMPLLFAIGTSLADSLYASVPAGGTIPADIAARPALALTMLAGMLAGILACITGLSGILRQRERAVLVYLSSLVGALLILFLIGEVLFPH